MTWTQWYPTRLAKNGSEWKKARKPTIGLQRFPNSLIQRLPRIGEPGAEPCLVQIRHLEHLDSVITSRGWVNDRKHNQFFPRKVKLPPDWDDPPDEVHYEARFDLPEEGPRQYQFPLDATASSGSLTPVLNEPASIIVAADKIPAAVKSNRFSRDQVGLLIAWTWALRGTCVRRKVGCLLTDADGYPLGSGYNGPASGEPHCVDEPCPGAELTSGTGLDKCIAIHAEQNALLRCSDIRQIDTCYVTASPCTFCVRLLLNTPCKRIVFAEEYPQSEPRLRWVNYGGREWVHLPYPKVPW